MQYFYREKIGQKFFGYFGNFQKTAQRKKSHNSRKFAQSGHPGYAIAFEMCQFVPI
jgi:hypothetical protein